MSEFGQAAWPPAPIRTKRLVLRGSEARNRAAFVELFASPEVGAYLGGPRPRDELERDVPEVPGRRPGLFVVDLDGTGAVQEHGAEQWFGVWNPGADRRP